MESRASGVLPKTFLHPCLLLLLKEEPGYGYDLVTRLKVLGIEDDSAAVYRALRALEEKSAVSSYWNTSSTGPARRMYRLTPQGEDLLTGAVESFRETHQAIERYLCRVALAQARPERVPPHDEGPRRSGLNNIWASARRDRR